VYSNLEQVQGGLQLRDAAETEATTMICGDSGEVHNFRHDEIGAVHN
jgi:hypothetical protein